MKDQGESLRLQNRRIRALIEAHGRRVQDFWPQAQESPTLENARLHDLLAWVRAYAATPDRKQLEQQGFRYPPVDDGFDADSDWLQFERWMAGQPLLWDYVASFGPMVPDETLDDATVVQELERVTQLLATRGVVVEADEDSSARVTYRCLKQAVEQEPFEFMPEGTFLHVIAYPYTEEDLPWFADEECG